MTAKHKRIELDSLLLGSNNARLPLNVRDATEQRIIAYMLLESNVLELMQAIGENGFFEGEQLLVVPEKDNKYRVVEGNRRLAAVKLLRSPELATVQQSKVQRVLDEAKHRNIDELPCLIFEDENEIHRYVGFRHITGIQPWNQRQRAEYLSSLRHELFQSAPLDHACRELAKIIGSRCDYVKRILVGFEIYTAIKETAFFGIKGLDDERFYFSHIADSLSRPNIAAFLGIDLESENPSEKLSVQNLKQWTRWFYGPLGDNQTRLKGTHEELTKLSAVLASERSRKAFCEEGRGLREAFELTADFNDAFRAAMAKALSGLEQADRITHKLNAFDPGLDTDLKIIGRLASKIRDAKKHFGGGDL